MQLRAAALGLLATLAAPSAATAAASSPSSDPFRPLRVRYDDLVSSSSSSLAPMMDALSDVGMVSVTGFPPSFRRARDGVRAGLAGCALGGSAAAREHAFDDGTKRTTLASHTVPGPGGMQKIRHGDDAPACAAFDAAAAPFRAGVDKATRAFAARVASATGAKDLLATEHGHAFSDFDDVVDSGEHLEHFHVYEKETADERQGEDTVEWHTDQGLLLAFSPGARAGGKEGGKAVVGQDDFFVRLGDGSSRRVAFDADDELVFLLGDGVEQVLNPALVRDGKRSLRALPHALRVASADPGEAPRVWYGRMVLPPADAVHPEHGQTFGHLRNLLAENVGEEGPANALGCSGDASARQLEEAQCEPGSTFCWHRCMPHEDHGVSVDICAEQGLDVRCINPRYQLYVSGHGDWFPGCIDASTAPNATDYDPLPNYPRDDSCDAEHEVYVAKNSEDYEHHAELPIGGNLYWTVNDDDTVRGMLSYDGLFGYLSYGWAGVGERNEMQQAHVVMAKVSAGYTARYGFDFDVEPAVHLHWIGDDLSFRHWQEPLDDWGAHGDGNHEIVEEDCFTALKFEASGIHDRKFNLTGTDRMMWAANGEDMFAGYHGYSRHAFVIDWMGGTVENKCAVRRDIDTCTGLPVPTEDEEEETEEKTEEEKEEVKPVIKPEETELEAELETGLPPVTATDADAKTEEEVEEEVEDLVGDEPDGGALEDKTEEVVDKVEDSAAPGLSFVAPAAIAVIAGFAGLV